MGHIWGPVANRHSETNGNVVMSNNGDDDNNKGEHENDDNETKKTPNNSFSYDNKNKNYNNIPMEPMLCRNHSPNRNPNNASIEETERSVSGIGMKNC